MNQNSFVFLMKRAWYFIIVNTLVFSLLGQAIADEKGRLSAMSTETIVASVRGNNMQTFENAANDLYVERQNLSRELLSILQDTKSSNFQKCSAAYFLGEMRIPDAVFALAEHVTLRKEASDYLVKGLPVMKEYPAVEALIKIGKPSTIQMIRNLEDSSDSLFRELSTRVIRDVEGADIGRIIIQKAIKKQANSKKKERLQAALSSKYLTDVQ